MLGLQAGPTTLAWHHGKKLEVNQLAVLQAYNSVLRTLKLEDHEASLVYVTSSRPAKAIY